MLERKETTVEIEGQTKSLFYYEDENHTISELYEWATTYDDNNFAFVKKLGEDQIYLRDVSGNLSTIGFSSLVKNFEYGLACVRFPDEEFEVHSTLDEFYEGLLDRTGKKHQRDFFEKFSREEKDKFGRVTKIFREKYAFIDKNGRMSKPCFGVSYAKEIISQSGVTNMAGETPPYDYSNLNAKVLVREYVVFDDKTNEAIGLYSELKTEELDRRIGCGWGKKGWHTEWCYSWVPLKDVFDRSGLEFVCGEDSTKLIEEKEKEPTKQ